MKAGALGEITVYIKSKELIQDEEDEKCNDEDEITELTKDIQLRGDEDDEEPVKKQPAKVGVLAAGVAHFKPVASAESAVSTVLLAPTPRRLKASAPVPAIKSPLASIAVAIELVTVTVPLVPPPLIPIPAVTPSISPVAPDATHAAPS
jgi:hypothetical protein